MTSLRKLWEKYNFENEDVEVVTESEVHKNFKKYMDYGLYDREELEPDNEEGSDDLDEVMEEVMRDEMEEEIEESSGAGAGAVVGAPGLGGKWVDEDEYRERIEDTKNRMHIKGK